MKKTLSNEPSFCFGVSGRFSGDLFDGTMKRVKLLTRSRKEGDGGGCGLGGSG